MLVVVCREQGAVFPHSSLFHNHQVLPDQSFPISDPIQSFKHALVASSVFFTIVILRLSY